MNILAACGGPDSPVRKVVFKSSAHYYGCERDDPAFFTEAMQRPHPPRTRLESDIVEAENAVRGFAERNPDVTVTRPALRQRPRAGPATPRTRGLLRAAGGPVHPRLRPALPVRPRGRHRRRARARGRPRPAGRLQRRRRRRARALGGREPARAPAGADPAAVGDRAGRRRRCAWPACGSRTRWPSSCATAAGWTTASSRRPAARLRYTTREAVQRFAEDLRVRELRPGRRRAIPLRARGRGVPALQPQRPAPRRARSGRSPQADLPDRCSYS